MPLRQSLVSGRCKVEMFRLSLPIMSQIFLRRLSINQRRLYVLLRSTLRQHRLDVPRPRLLLLYRLLLRYLKLLSGSARAILGTQERIHFVLQIESRFLDVFRYLTVHDRRCWCSRRVLRLGLSLRRRELLLLSTHLGHGRYHVTLIRQHCLITRQSTGPSDLAQVDRLAANEVVDLRRRVFDGQAHRPPHHLLLLLNQIQLGQFSLGSGCLQLAR